MFSIVIGQERESIILSTLILIGESYRASEEARGKHVLGAPLTWHKSTMKYFRSPVCMLLFSSLSE